MARKDMEQNFGTKVNLKTWVKVKEDWMITKNFLMIKYIRMEKITPEGSGRYDKRYGLEYV